MLAYIYILSGISHEIGTLQNKSNSMYSMYNWWLVRWTSQENAINDLSDFLCTNWYFCTS